MPSHRLLCLALALTAVPALAKPPRLVLFVSVDSFGTDVLQRNRPRLKGGLARLMAEGAFFPVVRYDTAECVTAAGHTTLTTGANPARHGIVGNRVLNRQTGKVETIFFDPTHPLLDAPAGSEDTSPKNLFAETLSDHLRASTWQRGRSVAIAGKGRAAIAMAGRLGDAWWFHEPSGRFVTSTWYQKEVPAWVKAFNERNLADASFVQQWELSAPQKEYLGDDDGPGESDWYGLGKTFPHPLSGGGGATQANARSYAALAASPGFTDLEVAFARAALEGEHLGQDEVTDLLSVSFSAVDRVYHLYGPSSWESQDMILRLDRAVGELVSAAEKAAGGKENLVVVLTGDHGGAWIPEGWAALGLDGVRVAPGALQKGLDAELEQRFGAAGLVLGLEETDVYLDVKKLAEHKLEGLPVRRAAAAWLARQADVQFAVASDDLGAWEPTGVVQGLRAGYVPERSGDVLVVMKPFRVLESEPRGTSHGTPWPYDAEVPLLLFGRGVKPGVYSQFARAVDIAPTVSALMEQGSPAMCEGHALSEALGLKAP